MWHGIHLGGSPSPLALVPVFTLAFFFLQKGRQVMLTNGEQPAPDIGGALKLADALLDQARGGEPQSVPALQPQPLPQLK